MSITLGTLAARLARTSPAINRAVRDELNEPLPVVRERVKASARAKLPRSGGLAEWAAASHVTAQVVGAGNTTRAHLRVHRTSKYKPSDLGALDRGRVRHPAWGRRGPRDWSIQLVPSKTFSKPIAESPEWRRAVVRAAQRGSEVITRGRG